MSAYFCRFTCMHTPSKKPPKIPLKTIFNFMHKELIYNASRLQLNTLQNLFISIVGLKAPPELQKFAKITIAKIQKNSFLLV